VTVYFSGLSGVLQPPRLRMCQAAWPMTDRQKRWKKWTRPSSLRPKGAPDGHKAGQDLADALHLASSEPAERFATFDSKFIQSAARLSGVIKVIEP